MLTRSLSRVLSFTTPLVGIFLVSLSTWSKPVLNSMCYLENSAKASVQGSNTDNRYEIASVSKIFTSFWALEHLGAKFRFKTRVSITAVSDGLYDVHVSGGKDPFFGREMTFFLVSELYRMNIRKIRQLSFDENLLYYWSVRERPSTSIEQFPERVERELKQRLRFRPKDYLAARRYAESVGLSMEAAPTLNISSVKFIPKASYRPEPYAKRYELRSAPLHKYLKDSS